VPFFQENLTETDKHATITTCVSKWKNATIDKITKAEINRLIIPEIKIKNKP
jgi:hypothetical protein